MIGTQIIDKIEIVAKALLLRQGQRCGSAFRCKDFRQFLFRLSRENLGDRTFLSARQREMNVLYMVVTEGTRRRRRELRSTFDCIPRCKDVKECWFGTLVSLDRKIPVLTLTY